MPKILSHILSLFLFTAAQAQTPNPIKWAATYKSISDTEGEVNITAIIEKGWHTYSQQANEAVPLPTFINFKESSSYQIVGEVEEKNAQVEFDEALGEKLLIFKDKAEFKQKLKLKRKGQQTILIQVEYILCDNKMCLPPTTISLSVKTH